MKIAIGGDHSAVELKSTIIKYLEELGHSVKDFGTNSIESVDYPVFAKAVAENVANLNYDCGILICGTGIGMSLAANKVSGIRAANCNDPYSAKLSKQHNNANIITFGARVVGPDVAKMIVKEWLDAEYEGNRHARRVDMISKIEKGEDL